MDMRCLWLAMAAVALVGCGNRPSTTVTVARKASGPTVEVSVAPIKGSAPALESRAQRITPEPTFTAPPTAPPVIDVAPPVRNTKPVEQSKPRRKRKRVQPIREEDAPGDTQIGVSQEPRRKKPKKGFDDLSEQERKRLIEANNKPKKFEEMSAAERKRLIEGG